MSSQHVGDAVTVRFFMPSPALAPYISTYYLTEVRGAAGTTVQDWLHPEWANVRLTHTPNWQAAIGNEALREPAAMIGTGPTCQATHFITGPARIWGIGVLPLGWARLCSGEAAHHADQFTDARTDPTYAAFTPLYDLTFTDQSDPAAEAARIDAYLLEELGRRPTSEDEPRIRAAHGALLDNEVATVGDLADRLALSPRSLERLSLKAFGFSPKLLLRRQRFLRSLAQFMLDPSLTWIRTLDWQYVDQAHFVRDFKRFMGMSPSAYAQLDHPVLRAAAQARAAAAGAAVQALHQP
ncbi:helix-turn-helix domain-containing protein [Novosphingobium sp. B 225]|uniref:helix-turn-helix domain-containing protein n=1 Tax=Novosphingobium sp. B 225 TaxID=1961849 RepID=UPI000B4AC168|nr:helix-turn-helix domain-containing protein [Novosphingobium sp. B 225]